MNKKKTSIIIIMLVAVIGMGTYLVADSLNIAGMIQTGDYFENLQHIELPVQSDNLNLQSSEIEDYYSVKVADLYNVDTIVYNGGNIEFAYNLDEKGNFIDGYITRTSDATANYQQKAKDCENLAYSDYCLTEEEYDNLTSDIPEIEELDSPQQYEDMSKEEKQAYDQQEAEIAQMYDEALSGYGDDGEAEGEQLFSLDDVIVDYYDDQNTFNQAISKAFEKDMTYKDLQDYIV